MGIGDRGWGAWPVWLAKARMTSARMHEPDTSTRDTPTPDTPIPGQSPPPAAENEVELARGVFLPASALRFSFARSSGPGGQNVNKRATKARLNVALDDLRTVLPPPAVARLVRLAGAVRVTKEGELSLAEEGSRSQHANRRACLDRLRELVRRALVPPRPRKATRPTRASKKRRVETKKKRAQVKRRRRKPRDAAGDGD